jgi:hypothetical protein
MAPGRARRGGAAATGRGAAMSAEVIGRELCDDRYEAYKSGLLACASPRAQAPLVDDCGSGSASVRRSAVCVAGHIRGLLRFWRAGAIFLGRAVDTWQLVALSLAAEEVLVSGLSQCGCK